MPHVGGKSAKKSSSSSTKRHFTVVMGNKEHGLYVSSSPSSAARKAVSKLCATDKKKKVQFSIREITQGSKKKTYGPYIGKMKKLDKPIELKGRIIKYSTDVYLDKIKTAVKIGKKVGNKMRGGVPSSNSYFYCSFDKKRIHDHICRTYTTEFKNEFRIDNLESIELKLVSYGHVFITNRSKGKFLREDNKREQIAIYACVNNSNETVCYAILRCDVVIEKYNIDFQSKILFLIPSKSNLEKIDNQPLTFNGQDSQIDNNLLFYEFKSFISSNGDLYRIIIPNNITNYHYLPNFFNNLLNGSDLVELRINKPKIKYPNYMTSRNNTSSNALMGLTGVAGLFRV